MFSNFKPCVIALCSFLIMTAVAAQSDKDSTDLQKMQESDFKAMDTASPVTVLTKGNFQKTFSGMRATVNNSGDYHHYHEKLRYEVIEHSGKLAIKKYTPVRTCHSYMYRRSKEICVADNRDKAGRSSIACVIPQGAKSCKSSDGSSYELTLSGLLMAETHHVCWHLPYPMSRLECAYKPFISRVYMWDTSLADK